MKGLLEVATIHVPMELALTAHNHLAQAGKQGAEGIALWAGMLEGEFFYVRETILPAQTAHFLAGGICATVDGAELHRINLWLYQHRMTLVAQLHSHPTEAYHSETDDMYPIATALGSLSLVIPNFAVAPFSLEHCAVYRLLSPGNWTELTTNQVNGLIHIGG
jgi:hypothetical protein